MYRAWNIKRIVLFTLCLMDDIKKEERGLYTINLDGVTVWLKGEKRDKNLEGLRYSVSLNAGEGKNFQLWTIDCDTVWNSIEFNRR